MSETLRAVLIILGIVVISFSALWIKAYTSVKNGKAKSKSESHANTQTQKSEPILPMPWACVDERLPGAEDGELFVIWDWDEEYALARFTGADSGIWFQYEGAVPIMLQPPEYQSNPLCYPKLYDEVRYWMPVHEVPEMMSSARDKSTKE